MNKKIKILIEVLVVVIFAAGGWWIWKSQTIEGPKGICGPKGMGPNYDVSYCDRSCNLDNDCQYTCGCGAINKNETCHDEGIIYDCVEREVKCEKGKCVTGEEKLPAEITCDWCGRTCVRYPISEEDCKDADGIFLKQCACPEVAPPENFICIEESGKCVQKLKSPIPPDNVISISKQEFNKGESVEFSINATVKLWTNEIPFKIVNEQGNPVNLIHSCAGFVGSGLDQFCKNGQIIRKDVDQICNISSSRKWCWGCSDALWQREEDINEVFVWDQKEYIKVTEECEGKTISREEKRQVESGKYKIVVYDSEENVHEKNFLIK